MVEKYGWDQTPTPDLGLDITKAPEDIQKLYKWVIQKTYGEDVASAYAQGLVAAGIIAQNAEAMSLFTSGQMDKLDQFVKDTLIELTDKDVISAPEIIMSRDGEATLSDRLDRDFGEFIQYRDVLNGAVRFVRPTMAITDIQESLNDGGKIVFLPGLYEFDVPVEYNPYVLNVSSDSIIEFSPGSVIKLKTHSNIRYKILNIENKSNIKIVGGIIDGSRELNTANTGEWGMGISIIGSSDITIEDTKVVGCWGDGLYIGPTSSQTFSKNITLTRFKADNNRRQGISVISVKGLRGDDVEISNTNGTLPEYGIDFEPNNDNEIIDDIVFNNLKTNNNRGNGVGFFLNNFQSKKKINAVFNNSSSVNDGGVGFGILFANFEADGRIVVNDLYVEKSTKTGIYHRSVSNKFSRVVYNNPVLKDVNTDGSNGEVLGSPICIMRGKNDYVSDDDFMLGNIEINHPKVIYEDVSRTSNYDIAVFDYVKDAAAITTYSDGIVLNGMRNGSIFQHSGITNAKIDDLYLSTYSYWPGESPVRTTIPIRSNRFKYYTVANSKQQILTLSKRVADNNGVVRIRVPYDMGPYRVYVRPPEDEQLYPLAYSKGLGKGIYINNVAGNGGSFVDVERIGGKWVIKSIGGSWEAET